MKKYSTICLLIYILILDGCKKPYEPPAVRTNYNYLVLDGVVNVGANAVTTIMLSRTRNLSDSIPPQPEPGAQVFIEGEAGGSFFLSSQGNGAYKSNPLNLPVSGKYRLKIQTSDGKAYQSDFVAVKQTPAIDSVTWKQDKDVTIFVHTHDPQNNTHYYRWDYEETFQYRPPIETGLGVANGLIYYIDSATQLYNCWATLSSKNISIASSVALSQDLISYVPVNVVFQHSEKMAIRYSINVKQYGLTKEAYQYWQIIQKSTQQTGTIFDPQPSQITGNIHCVSNPAEPVIGFASASIVTEKRIFIGHKELQDWVFLNGAGGSQCKLLEIGQSPVDFRIYKYPDTAYAPVFFISGGSIAITRKDCIDCRRRGGSTTKPVFWK